MVFRQDTKRMLKNQNPIVSVFAAFVRVILTRRTDMTIVLPFLRTIESQDFQVSNDKKDDSDCTLSINSGIVPSLTTAVDQLVMDLQSPLPLHSGTLPPSSLYGDDLFYGSQAKRYFSIKSRCTWFDMQKAPRSSLYTRTLASGSQQAR